MEEKKEGMLTPYRVLDLTDLHGLLVGKLLGDLGADVIKIERPGGDMARDIGPFYQDDPDPEKSLFWWAFNTSKRGITLDIESADGQAIFKKLVGTADFITESYPAGYMDRIGLGYDVLEKINPGIIMVALSPFGQTGPYKDYKDSGIVAAALGWMMDQFDDTDRPPIWIGGHPQTSLLGSMEAASAAMLALFHRGTTGEGQYVDVSIHETVSRGASAYRRAVEEPPSDKTDDKADDKEDDGSPFLRKGRSGGGTFVNPTMIRRIWPCKDGYVILLWWAGPNAKRWNSPLVEWMDSEGMAGYLKEVDWDAFDWRYVTWEQADQMEEPTLAFFAKHTKAELLEGALKFKAMVYPVSTCEDTLQNPQLEARGFWQELEHPELNASVTYPGEFGVFSEAPAVVSRRPPLIGEHNKEILEEELGMSAQEVLALKQSGVI
ncbi:MAG: CaiB/BaiF CoA-transferase family protein [Desulfobacterales bacterium]